MCISNHIIQCYWNSAPWHFDFTTYLIVVLICKSISITWYANLYNIVTIAVYGYILNCSHMMTSSNGNIFRVTGPLCGEFTGPGEFPTQRPVTRSFDVFFDLRLNKRLSKQPWGWWFETPSWSFWRQCNENRHTWNFLSWCEWNNDILISIWNQPLEYGLAVSNNQLLHDNGSLCCHMPHRASSEMSFCLT